MPPVEREAVSYDVRLWGVRKVVGKRGTTYDVRWVVAKRQRAKAFATRALAEAFRGELRSAINRGEPFDVAVGLPVGMLQAASPRSWWDWALEYTDLKWPTLAPRSRLSVAEALTSVTMALLATDRGKPPADQLRSVMRRWAFVTSARAAGGPPAELETAAGWLAANTLPLASLEKAAKVRDVLTALSKNLDGTTAAATTIARKRAVFHNALALAVEREYLPVNPLDSLRWRAPKTDEAVDPATVVNPTQARALLAAVADVDRGERLVALFGLMYYAALRPSEAVAVQIEDLDLPAKGDDWGWIRLSRSNAAVATRWTDSGRRQARQLKHRSRGSVRVVPCAPALVALLKEHLDEYGVAADGRLFRGPHDGALREDEYLDVWRAARALAGPDFVNPSLARRPYDLRHAAVSTWLAAGVDPAQVAAWAGHSVAVLLRVYVHVMQGRDATAIARISRMLDS